MNTVIDRLRRACALGVFGLVAGSLVQAADTGPVAGKNAIVFGGSGQLGSEVARELIAAGYKVTVFIRPSSSRARLAGLPVTLVEGNVLVDADVQRAMQAQRFRLVVDALGRSENDVSFFATSGQNIARWSKATGVAHIVLHSSVGVGNSRAAYPPQLLGRMEKLFAAKGAGEQAMIDSGIPYTIIRNAVLRELAPGAEDRARLTEDQMTFGVVSRRGLARLTRECAENKACANRIYHGIDAGMKM